MRRISGPQEEIEMINVINNGCNLLSYSFMANTELLPAVRNTHTLFQKSNNALLCSFSEFDSRTESTEGLDGS